MHALMRPHLHVLHAHARAQVQCVDDKASNVCWHA
jgi:hypothetical protein